VALLDTIPTPHLKQSLADLQSARELIDFKLDRYRSALG
jgi:hypothetical protein